MNVNIKKGLVARNAAACAPTNMASVAGIAAIVDILSDHTKDVENKISVGSRAIFSMAPRYGV